MEQCAKKPKLSVKSINEGGAKILMNDTNVFYNPVQEFNRDLSIAVLITYIKGDNTEALKQDGITVLEALSATGLRSIRFAKEVQGIKQIVANDICAAAVECIKKNIQHNEVEHIVKPSNEDATLLMYQRRRDKFNVIDLDPYGCPTIFLDAAVQSVSDGGLLMVTATDMAVLVGNFPETCFLKYGSIPLRNKACHEMALRILLQNIASHAGRHGRYIVPMLSVSADFYIRVFVKLFTNQLKCKENTTKIGMVYQCTGCETLNTQPLCCRKPSGGYKLTSLPCVDQLCKICNHKHHEGGPIWLGPLHDQHFVSQLLSNLGEMKLVTLKRIEGVLNVIHEELDVPLYYSLDRLMSIIKCVIPSMLVFRSALINAGYRVSYSHACKTSVKTDAPNEVIWDIIRAWEKKNPIKRDKLPNDSSAIKILDTPITTDVSFDIHPLANPVSRKNKLSRFQQNPTVNWGPGTRARTRIDVQNEDEISKKIRNQNKHSRKGESRVIENTEETKPV